MATHSSILAWKTPWIEESMGLQRVRHNQACVHVHTHAHTHTHTHTQHKLLVNAFTEEVMVLSESPNIFLSRTVPEKSSQAKEGGIAKLCQCGQ